ncbi:MAG TPA: protein kinase [Terriglobales bacterium]|nr:protein kinase [Terriglobales bacterium]
MIGQTLGHYRILEKIGDGGMGEVFRARDDRLARDVAVKVVRPAASSDQDRLRRFEQEARAAAALSHPNIVAIYDVGVHDGSPYIVSELLEGETLRERLFEGPLPVKQALDYALQTVQGLVAAHDKHIVHRDLKPENLFITRDGRVKILDFGIAKLLPSEETQIRVSATMTTQTKSGLVLGTVAYMSPEQLRGKAVDHRSDIFTFGAILYEMLAGQRAFRGETNVDTITAVLKDEPTEIHEIRPGVPPAFEPVVAHCLEKDPENRFQSARDLAFALATTSSVTGKTAPVKVMNRRRRARLAWILAAVFLVAAALLVGSKLRSPENPVYRRLTFERGTIYSARFTPDARSVLYGASWNGGPLRLYSTLSTSPLEHALDLSDAHLLAVSRSNEIAVELHGNHGSRLEFVNGTLARASVEGGATREILEGVRWADWAPNGELAVVHHVNGRSRLEFPIGKVLYETDGWISHARVSPQGDKIAFLEHPALWDDRGTVAMVDLTGQKKTLTTEWGSEDGLAWNSKADELWFTAVEEGYNRALWAVSLSGRQRKILSVPGGLTLQDVAADGRVLITFDNERLAMETSSADGSAVQDLSWYDWTIAKEISPDGQSVLFEESSEPAGPHYAVAMRKLDGSAPVRLGDGSAGGLSPDGKWVVAIFTGSPEHLVLLPTGAGEPREISASGVDHLENGSARFMPDGKKIIFGGNQAGHSTRTYLVPISGGAPRPITPEGTIATIISPGGDFVAGFDSSMHISLYPVNGGSPRVIPGLENGFTPAQWSEDGSALYVYREGEIPLRLYRVEIASGKQKVLREVGPARGRSGVVSIGPIAVNRDASKCVYSYYHALSVLYVISGLK